MANSYLKIVGEPPLLRNLVNTMSIVQMTVLAQILLHLPDAHVDKCDAVLPTYRPTPGAVTKHSVSTMPVKVYGEWYLIQILLANGYLCWLYTKVSKILLVHKA